LGSSVTVTNPIHPLYGQSVVIRQIRKVGFTTKVTVESPLGGFLSLLADETNLFLEQKSDRQLDKIELFSPEKLLRLSEWVAARSKSFIEKQKSVLEDKEVERNQKNDTTTSTKVRSTRKRRKDATPNQANSTASRQNAAEEQQSTGYPDKE
jgi:hypothetical protein